ncbi:rCG56700 [Rattus norvegicus]|uniref:RCG56700 n=1 Tax=Rattus norvegicus TaxID=10116 RepID=A6KER5_RAT|nr:rCG56700 [Rattus norvegicus]
MDVTVPQIFVIGFSHLAVLALLVFQVNSRPHTRFLKLVSFSLATASDDLFRVREITGRSPATEHVCKFFYVL